MLGINNELAKDISSFPSDLMREVNISDTVDTGRLLSITSEEAEVSSGSASGDLNYSWKGAYIKGERLKHAEYPISNG